MRLCRHIANCALFSMSTNHSRIDCTDCTGVYRRPRKKMLRFCNRVNRDPIISDLNRSGGSFLKIVKVYDQCTIHEEPIREGNYTTYYIKEAVAHHRTWREENWRIVMYSYGDCENPDYQEIDSV